MKLLVDAGCFISATVLILVGWIIAPFTIPPFFALVFFMEMKDSQAANTGLIGPNLKELIKDPITWYIILFWGMSTSFWNYYLF